MKLIGPAGKILSAVSGLRYTDSKPVKLMLYGPPGVGKTALAEALASSIGDSKWDIESINGRNVTIDVVRDWQQSMHCSSMYGEWKVRIINEADVMPRPSQDLMLTLLDELPPKRAFIVTSNLDLDQMTPRFRTRFMTRKVEAPKPEEIATLLMEQGLPSDQAAFISTAAAGNVRAALLDADAWLNEQSVHDVCTNHQQNLFASLGI